MTDSSTLTPGHYRCRSHERDLTAEVKAKVTADPTLVTNMGWRPSPGGTVRSGTFRVDVSCPGDSTGQGTHVLRFRGRYVEGAGRPALADLPAQTPPVPAEPIPEPVPAEPVPPPVPAEPIPHPADAPDVPTDVADNSTQHAGNDQATAEIAGQDEVTAAAPVSTAPAPVSTSHAGTDTDTGLGEEVAADDFWAAARAELRPEKSLARVGAQAKYVVSTVTVVGLALTALGLVTAAALTGRPLAKLLAACATGAALLAVVLALSYLATRPERLNTEDLDQVEDWYRGRFDRVWRVTIASGLLLTAVVLAGAAGVVTLVTGTGADRPVLTLSVQGSGTTRSITASVQVADLKPGTAVGVTVTGAGSLPLVSARTTADALGKASVTASVAAAPVAASYRLTVRIADSAYVATVP